MLEELDAVTTDAQWCSPSREAGFPHFERRSARTLFSPGGDCFGPAIAEAQEVMDFGECFIALEE
jgi:hypothetical protein